MHWRKRLFCKISLNSGLIESKGIRWFIKAKAVLTPQIFSTKRILVVSSIILAIMISTASSFEQLQSSSAFSWYTDSGFSGEDLVSDLFGFYRCTIPGSYSRQVKPVSYEAAVRRWDFYGSPGKYKNQGFRRVLFPDPDDICALHKPFQGILPTFMTWISPWQDFSTNIVKIITNDGTNLEFRGNNQ